MKIKSIIITLIALFSCVSVKAQEVSDKEFLYTTVLETFCQEYYNGEFKNRLYKPNTLTIRFMEEQPDGSIEIEGTHSCQGEPRLLLGRAQHNNILFKAVVRRPDPSLLLFKVVFSKWFERELLTPGHWEESKERTVYFE